MYHVRYTGASCGYSATDLVTEGEMLEKSSLEVNVALESAVQFPTSKTRSPRHSILTAQNPSYDNMLGGCEIGRQRNEVDTR